jgi:hypothetical protein
MAVHFQAGWSSAKQSEEVLETYVGMFFDNTETSTAGDTFVVSNPAGPNPPTVVSSTNYANASLFFLTDPMATARAYPTPARKATSSTSRNMTLRTRTSCSPSTT